MITTLHCRYRGFFVLFLSAAIVSGCFSSSTPPAPTTKDWTIMVYLDGDDDALENNALTDFNEMEKGLYDAVNSGNGWVADRVNVVVMIDRHQGGTSRITEAGGDDWTDTRLYRVRPDNSMSYFNSERIDDGSKAYFYHTPSLGEKNMADPSTLSDFINYSKENFPADHYALILWNHGGAAQKKSASTPEQRISKAICWDGDNGDDTLYIDELQQALEENFDSSDRLDILGFDACLMATIEVAYEVKELADYMVASMNYIQADGWSYDRILGDIGTRLTTPSELAIHMAQTYKHFIEASDDYVNIRGFGESISVTNLANVGNLALKVDALGVAIANEGAKTNIETLREATFNYYDIDNNDLYLDSYSKSYPYYDLYDLCERINTNESFSDTLRNAAVDVISALSTTIDYSYGDTCLEGNTGQSQASYSGTETPKGLSIFFSRGESHYADQWWYTNEDTAFELGDSEKLYGHLDFCTSNADGTVDGWRELMEYWYDNPDSNTPSSF